MSLPKQVQDLADEAERLQQELQAPQPLTEPTDEELNRQQPVTVAEETPPVEVKPEPVTHAEDETWQRRYQTLQGKFNAEVPRLNSEVKELKHQLAEAIARIDQATKPAPTQHEKLVTDKDVEAFGSDLVDLVKRQATEVARAEMGQEIDILKAKNAELVGKLTGVTERQGKSDLNTYFAELARLVPDYEVINVDPGFMEWLADTDPLSGHTRQDYLNEAFGSFNSQRTATLFNTYKQLTAAPAVPEVPRELTRQVAPGTSKVSAKPPTNAETKIWRSAEVDQFFRSVTRGDYKGNESEQARIEAEIDLAVMQGRLMS